MAIGIPIDLPGFGRPNQRFMEWARQGMVPSDVIAAATQPRQSFTGEPIAMNPLINFSDPGLPQDEPPTLREGPSPNAIMLPPPRSMRPVDIGMGIPLPPSEAVTSQDLPALPSPSPSPAPAPASMARSGGGSGFRMPVPMAGPSPSRRYSSTRPEFIFTNPAAAQQAASNYAARLGFESAQDQGYRDYLSRLNADEGATERANVQGQIYGQQITAAGREGAANRESAERIALGQETIRQQRLEQAQRADQDRAAQLGEQTAEMLNRDPNAKVDRKWVWLNPATGRWESRFRRPAAAAPPIAVPEAAPASSVISVLPVPSPGPRAPAPTDFAVPIAPLQ